MQNDKENVRLTEYAHGAGCGCKIAPQVLTEILSGMSAGVQDSKLIVGNSSNDDAAVYDMGNGIGLISTTDFFMPIVDDAFDFGRVAAANAISDVYAMGGQPILALAILGWPVDKLPAALASRVMEGARQVCNEAGITLAGGHSIDTTEPVFGLSVNGTIRLDLLKRNNTAQEGDLVFMTKPIGSGVLSTARKRKLLRAEDEEELMKALTTLNKAGAEIGKLPGVTAMTDITGFGLLGHLTEIAGGSGLTAELHYGAIPKMKSLPHYISLSVMPDATFRNWNAYSKALQLDPGVNAAEAFMVLPDPQTNGGLLFTARPQAEGEVAALLAQLRLSDHVRPIGRMVGRGEKTINVLP